MGLAKIILLVLGLILVVWLVRSYRRRVDGSDNPGPAKQGENMVRCAHCGVHLPRSESLTTQGSYYCSAEHQRAHREGRSS